MKKLRIFVGLCIILIFSSSNGNAQVTHETWAYSNEVTDIHLDCIDVTLNGKEDWTWSWIIFPDFGFRILIKAEGVYLGTDNKNYTFSLVQNENWNPNKQNYTYCSTYSGHLMCEGKIVGLIHWTAHLTLPANREGTDWTVNFERSEIKCK